MKKIKLTQGKFALVDDEDFEYLSQWKWSASKGNNTFYAQRCFLIDGKKKSISMHREVLKLKPGDGILTDHKDHDGLNNQKSNLRKATYLQNQYNKSASGQSKYLGVSFEKDRKKWRARMKVGKIHKCLGRYNSEIEAAVAYDKAAKQRGEFANLNFK